MKLINKKDSKAYIYVEAKRNVINTKRGFVVLTGNSVHYGHNTVRTDIINKEYIIPKNVTFKE